MERANKNVKTITTKGGENVRASDYVFASFFLLAACAASLHPALSVSLSCVKLNCKFIYYKHRTHIRTHNTPVACNIGHKTSIMMMNKSIHRSACLENPLEINYPLCNDSCPSKRVHSHNAHTNIRSHSIRNTELQMYYIQQL